MMEAPKETDRTADQRIAAAGARLSDEEELQIYQGIRAGTLERTAAIPPITVTFDLTGFCNHSCRFCFYADDAFFSQGADRLAVKRIGMIETGPVLRALDELARLRTKSIIFSGGGEPVLHRDFVEILNHAIDAGFTVGVVTNLATDRSEVIDALARASWVRVSLNASNDDEFQRVHRPKGGGRFEDILDRAAELRKRGTPSLGWSYIITEDNYRGFLKAAALARDRGFAFFQLRYCVPISYESKERMKEVREESLADRERLKELQGDSFRIVDLVKEENAGSAEKRAFNNCPLILFSCQIGADGFVYPCCTVKYCRQYRIGNIVVGSFEEIWMGEGRKTNLKSTESCHIEFSNVVV